MAASSPPFNLQDACVYKGGGGYLVRCLGWLRLGTTACATEETPCSSRDMRALGVVRSVARIGG